MKQICIQQECTGCGLCVVSCSKKSISMQPGNLGHLFPVVNQETCIDCGFCQKVCPSINKVEKKYPKSCYASWAKEEHEYKSSTSGGVAAILSKYIIGQGGIVYGCAMLPNVDVKHIRVDSYERLSLLKGSKYVQSSIVDIIPYLKQDVKDGKKVLFVGTPCQVAAIKKLFIKDQENLFLVDLICHGVPSLNVLRNHIKTVSSMTDKTKVVFRDGTNHYLCKIVEDNKTVYNSCLQTERYKDFFINAFFDGYISRDSCSTCTYAQPNRCSDLTIGDFWGLGKHISAEGIPPHDYGCSAVLPITEKGQQLVDAIVPMMNMYERDVEEAVAGNTQLRFPLSFDNRIILFRKYYSIMGTRGYFLINLDKIFLHFYGIIKKKLIVEIKRILGKS